MKLETENQFLPTIPEIKEIPYDQTPRGRFLGTYKNMGKTTLLQAQIALSWSILIVPLVLLCLVFGGLPNPFTNPIEFWAYPVLVGVAALLLCASIFLYIKSWALKGDQLDIYTDGFIFHTKTVSYRYLWWLNLVNYEIKEGKPNSQRMILNLSDGNRFTFNAEYPGFSQLITLLPRITSATLLDRVIEALHNNREVEFGELTFSTDVLKYRNTEAKWPNLLKIEYDDFLKSYIIWAHDDVETESPDLMLPKPFVILSKDKLPNQAVFVEFMQAFLDYKLHRERVIGVPTGLITIYRNWKMDHQRHFIKNCRDGLIALLMTGLLLAMSHDGISFEKDAFRADITIFLSILGTALGCIYLLDAIRSGFYILWPREVTCALYDSGVVGILNYKKFYCSWADLEGFRFSTPWIRFFVKGSLKLNRLQIYKKDGQSFELKDTSAKLLEFLNRFRYAARKTLYSEAETRLRQGGTIEFGPLTISLTKLTFRGRTIECSEIAGIEGGMLFEVHIYRKRKTGKKSTYFASVNASEAMNFDVLVRLLKQLTEMNAQRGKNE